MDKMPDLYALVVKQIFLTKGLSTGFVAIKARSKWSATGVVKIYAREKRDIEESSFWCQQKEMPQPTFDEQKAWFGETTTAGTASSLKQLSLANINQDDVVMWEDCATGWSSTPEDMTLSGTSNEIASRQSTDHSDL
jgi:hypothetical protein